MCLLVAIAAASCVACDRRPEASPRLPNGGVRGPSSAGAAESRDFAAQATALLSVSLRPDGTAELSEISPRPIPFRRARLVPFDARVHGGALTAGAGDAPGNTRALVAPVGGKASVSAGLPRLPGAPAVGRPSPGGAILVEHASQPEPLVVPIDLGAPGEGGGDVVDRWQVGQVILRAPYFGVGTRYTVVRLDDDRPQVLAEREAQP